MLARCYLRFIFHCTNFLYVNFRPIWLMIMEKEINQNVICKVGFISR